MNDYIAFFRGINVCGKNLIPMKGLVALMQSCGFKNVKTYIQSGNVVFQSEKKPDSGIAAMINAEYGFEPDVLFLHK